MEMTGILAEDVPRRIDEIYGKEDLTLDPVLDRLQFVSLPKEPWR
jgi:hypothetical protein